MNAATAWRTLHRQGGHLYLAPGGLRCKAPTGQVAPELRRALSSHRRILRQALNGWGPVTDYLVLWFIEEAPLRNTPFHLDQGCRVTDPVRFYCRLYADIQAGAGGPRARTGALQHDLRLLYEHDKAQGRLRMVDGH